MYYIVNDKNKHYNFETEKFQYILSIYCLFDKVYVNDETYYLEYLNGKKLCINKGNFSKRGFTIFLKDDNYLNYRIVYKSISNFTPRLFLEMQDSTILQKLLDKRICSNNYTRLLLACLREYEKNKHIFKYVLENYTPEKLGLQLCLEILNKKVVKDYIEFSQIIFEWDFEYLVSGVFKDEEIIKLFLQKKIENIEIIFLKFFRRDFDLCELILSFGKLDFSSLKHLKNKIENRSYNYESYLFHVASKGTKYKEKQLDMIFSLIEKGVFRINSRPSKGQHCLDLFPEIRNKLIELGAKEYYSLNYYKDFLEDKKSLIEYKKFKHRVCIDACSFFNSEKTYQECCSIVERKYFLNICNSINHRLFYLNEMKNCICEFI